MQWYLKCWKNYVNFSGRARRTEYWMFVLFNVVASIVLGIVQNILGLTYLTTVAGQTAEQGILTSLYSLAVFLPALAVLFRRLHDIGKSGWWILISLVPLIGWIWLLVLELRDSDYGPNRYGPNPKGMGNPVFSQEETL